MGILNVTPDSFSDGGKFFSAAEAIARCYKLLEEGAHLVDIGGESTRPGAEAVDSDEEWRRIEPVIKALARDNLLQKLSVDTRKTETMLRCLDLGITTINSVGGLPDKNFWVKARGFNNIRYVCMHMHLQPKDMQLSPLTGNAALAAVRMFFDNAQRELLAAGLNPANIYLDPGIGFGKDVLGNLLLLNATAEFSAKYNVCIGLSRKAFLGALLSIKEPLARDEASKLLEVMQVRLGAKMIRTHNVGTLAKLLA